MKVTRKLLYFGSFVGLALTAALVVARVGRPSIAALLIVSVVAASVAGAPGLIQRRAWPAALILLPLGAYLLLRAQVPIPAHVHGLGAQTSYLLGQLHLGAKAYVALPFPLTFSSANHVALAVSLAVYATVWLAAFLALSLRWAVPGLVVVLVVLGIGFTTDDSARIVWAPLVFLVLGGCLLTLSRSLERERWQATDALVGVTATLIAGLLALSLLGTTSVASGQPWRDWRAWGTAGPSDAHLGFDWMQNYPSLLDPANDAPVMRVNSPLASYWRANALDVFNGTTWSSIAPSGDELTPIWEPGGTYKYLLPTPSPEPSGRLVTESFHVVSTFTDHLFSGGSAESLRLTYEVPLRVPATQALSLDSAMGPTLNYSITAVVPQLKPADLLGRGRDYPAAVLRQDTALPFPALANLTGASPETSWRLAMSGSAARREWLGLYRLNQQIVGTSSDPYEIALKIEEYLRANYGYSLTPPPTGYQSPYAAFLFRTKSGYCQQFAGAMAVLLRFNGVPARVALGFASGKRDKDGSFLVTRNDAHAWVEVYFPQVGWVQFDPTPGSTIPGAGPSSANAGFAGMAAGAGAEAAGSAGVRPNTRALATNRGANEGGATGAAPAPAGRTFDWLLAGAALVALLVAWPMGRALLRRRGLNHGDPDARLRAAVALVYADLQEYGRAAPRSQTLDETARYLKSSLDLDAVTLVERVQAVLFGGRAATEQDLADVAAFRRDLRRRLRAHTGWLGTALALYGLTKVSPVRA
jgi:transglutaminase-like putative cysteine protease